MLAERRQYLDSADTITAFAQEMGEFLKDSELTETKAFVHSLVKEIQVKPGNATIVYSIPTPEDSPMGGASVAEVALKDGVRKSVRHGGPRVTNGFSFRWHSVFGGPGSAYAKNGVDPGGFAGVHARSAIGDSTAASQ